MKGNVCPLCEMYCCVLKRSSREGAPSGETQINDVMPAGEGEEGRAWEEEGREKKDERKGMRGRDEAEERGRRKEWRGRKMRRRDWGEEE